MKAILVLFDSLNRHMLEPYGGDWVHTPNFQRLAERSVKFDRCYVGSMPCMPARRDLHTGRYNFLHRSWGPLEPFDDSMPKLLSHSGVYTHLVSDHYHYWETGGATYHTQYDSWEFSRGQEGDPWKGEVGDPGIPEAVGSRKGAKLFRQDWINRKYMADEASHSQARTFKDGLDFIERNHKEDKWLLQIEAFDPHEPFFTHDAYKQLYPHDYRGPLFDWPVPGKVKETPEQVEHARYEYAALVSMCDAYLGKVLDKMDEHGLWEDTMLIVGADHGYLLGEHDHWAKNVMPLYQEIANTPLFVWDPKLSRQGEACQALVQWIDLAPTLLKHFGLEPPSSMIGRSLAEAVRLGEEFRDAVLFGYHGAHVNCTDGRYVYMRASAGEGNGPLYEYTLMPTHMAQMFSPAELQEIELAEPFPFTKGVRTLKIPVSKRPGVLDFGTLLFDTQADPRQREPIQDAALEQRMAERMIREMKRCDAPVEQYARLGLEP